MFTFTHITKESWEYALSRQKSPDGGKSPVWGGCCQARAVHSNNVPKQQQELTQNWVKFETEVCTRTSQGTHASIYMMHHLMIMLPGHVHPTNLVTNPLITGQKMCQHLHRWDQEERAAVSGVCNQNISSCRTAAAPMTYSDLQDLHPRKEKQDRKFTLKVAYF